MTQYNVQELLNDKSRWNAALVVGQGLNSKRLWTRLDKRFVLCFHEMETFPTRKYIADRSSSELVGYHNHPWDFQSLILAGGYCSKIGFSIDGKVPPISVSSYFPKGSWHMLNTNMWHTVEPIDKAHSVVLMDRKRTTADVAVNPPLDTHISIVSDEEKDTNIKTFSTILKTAVWEPEFYKWSDDKKMTRYRTGGIHAGFLACDTNVEFSNPAFKFTYGDLDV